MTQFTHHFSRRSTYIGTLFVLATFGWSACSVQTEDEALSTGGSSVDGQQETGGASSSSGGNQLRSDEGTGGEEPNLSSGGTSNTGGDAHSGDPSCERGIKNNANTVCCLASCGFCGGTACEDNPGGEEACCAGVIGSSGVSCSENEAPCSLDGDQMQPGTGGSDGTGGATSTGGASGTGGNDPGKCTLDTPVDGLPSYEFTMHNVLTKRMERKDFCDADKWYSEWLGADGKPVQEFSLHQGDDMADHVPGGRSHQRCEFEDGVWATKGEGKWIEWEGRYLINKHPEITVTIGQMFGPNGPDARIEIRTNGSIGVGSLKGGSGNVTLSNADNVGQSFKIKMRTNGERVEVYFNGEKEVDRPTNGSNGQKWHFRWGVYSNEIPKEATPLTNTVTELVVKG